MLKSDKIKTLATIIAAFTIGFIVGIFLQPSIVTLLNLENMGVPISSVEKIDDNTASVQKKPSPPSSIPTLTPIITNTPNITSPPYDKTPTYSVLPILFVPKDLQADYSLLNSIDITMQEVQSWYSSQLGGRTFKVNPSIVVVGNHELKWYCPKTTRANQCVQVPGVLGADAGDSGNVLKDLNSQGYMVKEERILTPIFADCLTVIIKYI